MSVRNSGSDPLGFFIGEWVMEARFDERAPADGEAPVVFEWLSEGSFLVQRWSVPIPEAPDGIAIIGVDPSNEGHYLQHYFDSRGVARLYRMTLDDHVWTLGRDEADLSTFGSAIPATSATTAGRSRVNGRSVMTAPPGSAISICRITDGPEHRQYEEQRRRDVRISDRAPTQWH